VVYLVGDFLHCFANEEYILIAALERPSGDVLVELVKNRLSH
jgi:hypothetical protein